MSAATGRDRTTGRPPNIVLIMADQWPAATLGAYGWQTPRVSPNLDRLAARGLVCERNYTVIPVCAPARAAMFTGLPPVVNGVTGNDDQPCPDQTPLFPAVLRKAGYRTTGVGKFHFSSYRAYPPDDLGHLGFDQALITEDPKHGAWLDWIARDHPEHYEQALAVSWPMPYLDHYPPDARDRRDEWEQAVETHLRPLQQPPHRRIVHPSPLPAELHQTSWITDHALHMIDTAAADGRPFLTYVSYVDPHDPYDPPEPFWSDLGWQDVPPPAPQEWSEHDGPWQYQRFRESMFELDSFDEQTWARLRAAFLASCRFVDDQIGRILDHLERTGLDHDTVVVFTSDHGDAIGDHGLLMKGPWHYDKVVRTPMIMAGPGIRMGARMTGLSAGIDLCPTILDVAGVSITDDRAGHGRVRENGPYAGRVLPYRDGDDPTAGHDRVLIETNASYLGERDPVRTVISDDNWRLTEFPEQDYGELFDLTDDPDEQRNRYADPSCEPRRRRMVGELVQALCEPSLIGRR